LAKDDNAIHHQRFNFQTSGDSQTSQIVYLGGDTTGGMLYSDGAGKLINVSAGRYIALEAQVIIVNIGSTNTSQFQLFACFKNTGGGIATVGAVTSIAIAEDSIGQHTANFSPSGTDDVQIRVTDSAGGSYRAVAYIRYTEILLP
jgi:hypothetical protein